MNKNVEDERRNSSLRETVYDMTWVYTTWHNNQIDAMQEDIVNSFADGSRGIFSLIEEEAKLFENWWYGLGEKAYDENYYEQVDTWIEARIARLVLTL